jgi:phosphoribosylaminoimidazole carboxylase
MLNILGGAQPDCHLCAAQQALSTPGARIHLCGKVDARPGRKMGHITILAGSKGEAVSRVNPLMGIVDRIRGERMQSGSGPGQNPSQSTNGQETALDHAKESSSPLVGVTMGSDSDRFVLAPGIDLLKELDVPHSVTITSAHRTPEGMVQFAKESASKGIKVIIAAARGSRAFTQNTSSQHIAPRHRRARRRQFNYVMDSLLSIVQMLVSDIGFRL